MLKPKLSGKRKPTGDDAAKRVEEIALNASMGVYPYPQFRVGQLSNKERYPELEALQAKDIQRVPEWLSPAKKSKRRRTIKLGSK